jgi:GNAT superfamily N-acetyltransferase
MDACVSLLEIVHARDHYPLLWPVDAAEWLSPRQLIAAWVAAGNDAILGHVALNHARHNENGLEWLSSQSLVPGKVVWISRLFVAPEARRLGLGSKLLQAAVEHAIGMGLLPALEVVESDQAAIELYEQFGLVRVHSRDWTLPSGARTVLHTYFAPLQF